MTNKSNRQLAKDIINREITALNRTVKLIDKNFDAACDSIVRSKGKIITLGLGEIQFCRNENGSNVKQHRDSCIISSSS